MTDINFCWGYLSRFTNLRYFTAREFKSKDCSTVRHACLQHASLINLHVSILFSVFLWPKMSYRLDQTIWNIFHKPQIWEKSFVLISDHSSNSFSLGHVRENHKCRSQFKMSIASSCPTWGEKHMHLSNELYYYILLYMVIKATYVVNRKNCTLNFIIIVI